MSRGTRTARGASTTAPVPGSWPVAGGTASLSNEPAGSTGWQLAVDGVPQSHVDLADPTVLVFEYVRWIGGLVDCLAPPGADLSTVHVGGGAGTLARYVAATRPGSHQVVLDPDVALLDLVREQLGLRSAGRLKVRAVDGRSGLAGCRPGSFDLVVRDAFADAGVPTSLVTTQWCEAVAAVLRPGGVLVCNLPDATPFPCTRAEVATLRTRFAHVLAVAEPGTLRGRRTGNVLLVASDAPLPEASWGRRLAGDAVAPVRLMDDGQVRDRFGGGTPLDDAGPFVAPPPRPRFR
ncbi:fused MFS/spermidine synthase [Aquipuribacter hungaricus]|uniref:Spermidine synthase n=1 Tax=Aquipuribacter hungaricus TaxID=545624 RepID=A0ABV7WK74_9MICO